jgi:hypothetical protein
LGDILTFWADFFSTETSCRTGFSCVRSSFGLFRLVPAWPAASASKVTVITSVGLHQDFGAVFFVFSIFLKINPPFSSCAPPKEDVSSATPTGNSDCLAILLRYRLLG